MGIDRDLSIRLVTNLDYFSNIIEMLINEGFSFSENEKIVSLSENDLDEFGFVEFNSFDEVKEILDKREDKGYSNYIIIWEKSVLDDRLLVRSTKSDNKYEGFKNYYEISFGIGHGKRIKGAERYTDYGVYLNRLIPVFVKNSIHICEINCCDFDC